MIRAHRIALDPNDVQRTYFAKACGTARFAYNWALAEWKRQYAAGEKPNQLALRRTLNSIKRVRFPWMLDVAKNAPQMAIINLGTAFKNFFDDLKKYERREISAKRIRRPRFQFSLDGSRIHLPHIGFVRMREEVRFAGKIVAATISRTAHRWFVSLTVDIPEMPIMRENQGVVGVDLGVRTLATLSKGENVPGAKPHKALLGRLRRLSCSLSRKVKGSANRAKAKAKLSRLHARIANVRKEMLHKMTTMLSRRFDVIGIENLNVAGMIANRRLARAISDMGFFEFRRQLEYKAAMQGAKVVVVDRFFPSSKLCSDCGFHAGEMNLDVRQWTCTNCGESHDRDLNAAKNLRNAAASSAVTVCGAGGSGARRSPRVKLPATKQKLGFTPLVTCS
jgi:putative transposase